MSHTACASWVICGDIHEEMPLLDTADSRSKEFLADMAQARGVIVSGDMTKAAGVDKAAAVLEALNRHAPVLYAQIGNMDKPEITPWLQEQGLNLHCRVAELAPGIGLMGLGGSTPTPFNTPSEFSESQFSEWLEATYTQAAQYEQLILMSHTPPHGTACDRLPNGLCVGSSAVREFIEKTQPALCICGHIHEARATDMLGKTALINPGAFMNGHYARLSVSADGVIRAELR